jgi:hypothetical protein
MSEYENAHGTAPRIGRVQVPFRIRTKTPSAVLFDDRQPGDEALTRTSSLADMDDQYGFELTAAAVPFPVRHPVVAAAVAGPQRRGRFLDVAAFVGRRRGRGLA